MRERHGPLAAAPLPSLRGTNVETSTHGWQPDRGAPSGGAADVGVAPHRNGTPPVVFMFPGQSSRSLRMFRRARELAPQIAPEILERASDVLGRDVEEICDPGRPDPFATNLDVQIGVFVANHIHAASLEESGLRPALSLGLSLGEYNHLVQIGALGFDDALRVIDARGRAYDRGPAGAMVAVFPLPVDELAPLLLRASRHGDLAISNHNSPIQHCVGGERAAVDVLIELVEEETFARATVIEERIPMHTPRFRPVAESFREVLAGAPWRRARAAYLPNVTGDLVPDPRAHEIASLLERHVFQPVRWRRSIETVLALLPDAVFVEAGPGRILAGLLRRSWVEAPRHTTHDGEAFAATLETLEAGRTHGA